MREPVSRDDPGSVPISHEERSSLSRGRTRAIAGPRTARALRFVILIGITSFFADFTHEGARSIVGPYLAVLGASGAVVGAVAGFGEFVGYGLRFVSGRLADRTRRFWPITIAGYVIQMLAVPALALAGSWPAVAALLVAERAGRATRNPPRDVMLSHAGQALGGYGWVFGLHEALDQFGALAGPLVVAGALAHFTHYHVAFAILAAPAACTLAAVTVARVAYPFERAAVVSRIDVPLFYAAAMAVSGVGSLVFGRLFDRYGLRILVPLTCLSALFAPLVFLGSAPAALAGAALWGLGMGVHESIVPAAVAPMVPATRRASAYGLFTAGYGLFWFLGSALIGVVYDHSVVATVALCVALELAAIPFFIAAQGRR
jgi:MFS family permease